MRVEFHDKGYRDAFVEENVRTGVAFQVTALREKRGWTQAELGERAHKPQNVISRIENPDYGKFTLKTLFDVASAFDVALLVKFVSYGELLAQLKDLSPEALAVPNFDEERGGSAREDITALAAPLFSNTIDAERAGYRQWQGRIELANLNRDAAARDDISGARSAMTAHNANQPRERKVA